MISLFVLRRGAQYLNIDENLHPSFISEGQQSIRKEWLRPKSWIWYTTSAHEVHLLPHQSWKELEYISSFLPPKHGKECQRQTTITVRSSNE